MSETKPKSRNVETTTNLEAFQDQLDKADNEGGQKWWILLLIVLALLKGVILLPYYLVKGVGNYLKELWQEQSSTFK